MDEPGDLSDFVDEVEIIELDDTVLDELDFDNDNQEGEIEEIVEDDVPVVDLARRTFTRHSKSVFQGVLNNAGTVAATGGEDDIAYVWSTETCEVLMECTGHKDSVTQLVFSSDEQLLATGDMGGLIQVWDLPNKKLVWCYEGEDLEWLLWHPKANVLFAGCEFGNIFVWQIPQGNCKVLASRGATSTCGHLLSDGLRLLAGYGNGRVCLWDIKAASVIWELQDTPMTNITSIDVTKDDTLFITAPSAQVYKISDGSLTATLLSTNETDVETVAFNSELGLVATGALSGLACIWDLKTNSIRHQDNIESAVTILKWGPNDTLILGSGSANVYVVDAKSGQLLQNLTGHKLDILSLSLSKDRTVLLSTSDDATAKVFAITSS